MANSTLAERPAKPRPDFPLFPHRCGRWTKKIRGKAVYFTRWKDDPKGDAALKIWLDQRDELLAGRTPRASADGLTIAELCNRFLTAKEAQRDAGDIRPGSFAEYLGTCKMLTTAFGRNRLVDDLAADDFQALRSRLSKQYGVYRFGNEIQRTRTVFKFAYEAGIIDKPMRFGPTFKRPAARLVRAHRQTTGPRMFEAEHLRKILDAADQPLKAMIYLGINCGFGNSDCGTLPMTALNLKTGWADYPRPKTAVERRCPLWPETVAAIEESVNRRPAHKLPANAGRVFITKYGGPWADGMPSSPVTKEFRKLLDHLKLYRRGLGFYALRHTFETIAGGSLDQVAVNHVMGHVDASMAAAYRERIDDSRLLAVTSHVREWLFPKRKAK